MTIAFCLLLYAAPGSWLFAAIYDDEDFDGFADRAGILCCFLIVWPALILIAAKKGNP